MPELFTKHASPEQARIEVLKTRACARIGESTGAFRVPQVLKLDEASGEMCFEHIPNLKPLRQLVVEQHARLNDFLHRAGRAMAVVHEQLTLPRNATLPLPGEWMSPGRDNVYVHGDFAGLNLCQSGPSEEVTIIDWSLAPFFHSPATFGSRWFDIIWFVLYLHQGVAREARLQWHPSSLAAAWLSGYQSHFELPADELEFADGLLRRNYWQLVRYYSRLQRRRVGVAAAARQAGWQSLLWWKHGRQLLRDGLAALTNPAMLRQQPLSPALP